MRVRCCQTTERDNSSIIFARDRGETWLLQTDATAEPLLLYYLNPSGVFCGGAQAHARSTLTYIYVLLLLLYRRISIVDNNVRL